MSVPTQTLQQFVNNMALSWGNSLKITPVLYSGSPVLAFFYAVGSQLDFQTAMGQAIVNFARASTATGTDLDSWMADFGFFRLSASYDTGAVTFSTSTANAIPAYVPVGAIIQTQSTPTIQYQVVADTTQSAYNASLDAYVLAANTTSMTAAVQAVSPGTASNVQANQLIQIATSLSGITTVTNPAAINNAQNGESDAQFRARFILWINSRSLGTGNAILAAAQGVQVGLDTVLYDDTNLSDVFTPGTFVLVIDDGSGHAPTSLVESVEAAIANVVAFSIQGLVTAATANTVTIALTIRIASGATVSTVEANVENAILAYINSLTIGQTLYISQIEATALQADSNVIAVEVGNTKINGSNADFTPSTFGIVRTILSDIAVTTF